MAAAGVRRFPSKTAEKGRRKTRLGLTAPLSLACCGAGSGGRGDPGGRRRVLKARPSGAQRWGAGAAPGWLVPRQSPPPCLSQPLPGAASAMPSPCSCRGVAACSACATACRMKGPTWVSSGSPGAEGSLHPVCSQPRLTAQREQDLLGEPG